MNPYRYPISPRLAAPTSVHDMMSDVLVALLPAFGMSLYLFGFRVLLVTLLSIGSCLFFQYAYGYLVGRNHSDLSPVVTGTLLAFCYPSTLDLWAVPLGSFFAIVVVKELYGGLGCNFINPALAGRTFIVSAPLLMTQFAIPVPFRGDGDLDVMTSATPLSYLQRGELPPDTLNELFIGFHGGSLGEVSTLMLLLGGCYLLLRRVITPVIPVSFLGTVAVLCYTYPPEGISSMAWMVAHLCSGGLVLGAFFMATDPVTSPTSILGQVVYGFGCGVLTLLLRYFGSYPEGVCYALLTMNCLVWLIDYIFAPRRFGTKFLDDSSEGLKELRQHWKKIHFVFPTLPKLSSLHPKHLLSSLKKQKDLEGKRTRTEDEEGSEPQASFGTLAFSYGMVLLVTVGCISWTYSLTQLQTHRTNELMNHILLEQAMPEADFLSETPYTSPSFSKLYSAYHGQDHLGYCVEVSSSGFIDQITLLVGVNLGGAVTGIAVLDAKETLQIGAEVLKEESLSRFVGRSGTLSVWSGNSIDSMSGATVTLEAVTDCVNRALEVVQLIDQVGALELLHDVL